MKTAKMLLVPILMAGVSMWGTSVAAEATMMEAAKESLSVTPAEAQPLARASELIGKRVTDNEGTVIGKVSDIVLTADRSKIAYLAVTVPDHSDQFRAVALNDLRMRSDGSSFVCASRADMSKMITFERNHWPDAVNDTTLKDAEQRARDLAMSGSETRTDTLPSSGAAFNTRLVSHLIGMEVRGSADKNICKIRDLVVAMDQGRIKEAAVGVGGVLGVGEKFAALDWNTVRVPAGAHYAQVNLNESDLQKIAYSEKEYWQNAGFVKPEKK